MSLGDFAVGALVDLSFTTRSGSVPTTLAGTPAVSVYKDNSSTESTAGVTLAVDFDSRTGLHHVRIDTSADGTFYSAGSSFAVVITAGTVGGQSAVGVVIDAFTLQHAYVITAQAIWDALTSALTTASSIGKLLVDNVNAAISSRLATGTVASDVTAIKAKTDNLPADTNSTLGTIAGYIDTEVAAIKAKTDNLPASPASWDQLQSAHTTTGTFGAYLDAKVSEAGGGGGGSGGGPLVIT